MTRASAALIVAIAALLVSAVGTVVAFTRTTDTEISDGSVEFADLAPDTRAELQGDPGKRGRRGPRGARGPSGPPTIGIPGRPGKDAPDVSARVETLEDIILYRFCDTWISIQDENGDDVLHKFC